MSLSHIPTCTRLKEAPYAIKVTSLSLAKRKENLVYIVRLEWHLGPGIVEESRVIILHYYVKKLNYC